MFITNDDLLRVLQFLSPDDLTSLKLVEKRMYSIVSSNALILRRPHYEVRINSKENTISFKKLHSDRVVKEEITEKSLDRLRQMEIFGLDLENFSTDEYSMKLFTYVTMALVSFKQFHIRNVQLIECYWNEAQTCMVEKLFKTFSKSVKCLSMKDCELPTISSDKLGGCKDLHRYEWLNSNTPFTHNHLFMENFISKMKTNGSQTFIFTGNDVSPITSCDIIEVWINLKCPRYFNFTLTNLDDDWKEKFVGEMRNRCIHHNDFEIQSREQDDAHIKVVFFEDHKSCRIHPVLDVPAKTPGQYICLARYYRDF